MDGGIVTVLLLTLSIKEILSKRRRNGRKRKVSVVIPAYNEEPTVAKVVRAAKECDLVDEVIVVDDGSEDNTYEEAKKAGAKVIRHEENRGKGEAMKTGLKHAEGDIVAFVDADIKNIKPEMIEKMIKPVLKGEADLVKTKFKRKAGRVTLLTAKPLLKFFFPEVAHLEQPLSGQICSTKNLLKKVKFEPDYGVDIGIILDAIVRGAKIIEVDIGEIKHDMQPLERLHKMALQVVRTILNRAHKYGRIALRWNVGKKINIMNIGLLIIALSIVALFYTKLPVKLIIAMAAFGFGVFIASVVGFVIDMIKIGKKEIHTLKTFVHMHASTLLTLILITVLIGSMFSSIQITKAGVEINPLPRKVLWSENKVKTEEPYHVKYGKDLEMGDNILNLLNLQPGDVLVYQKEEYTVHKCGDPNQLIIPKKLAKEIGMKQGNATDSEILLAFRNFTVIRTVDNNFIKLKITAVLSASKEPAKLVTIKINNKNVYQFLVSSRGSSLEFYIYGYGIVNIEHNFTTYINGRYLTIQVKDVNASTTWIAPPKPTPIAIIEVKPQIEIAQQQVV